MPIYETFSKRQQRLASQGVPTIYQYEELPKPFRAQVVHIWRSALGMRQNNTSASAEKCWKAIWGEIHDTIARETGQIALANIRYRQDDCEYFVQHADIGGALDMIELSFWYMDTKLREPRPERFRSLVTTQDPDDAIAELNHRFREHSVGYQYLGGQIVRVDSQYIHTEIVEPALVLLHERGFKGPEDEFLRAHEHFRAGKNKEAIVEALKAFESTMKAICDERGWQYTPTATAKDLINVLFNEGLIPPFLQTQFTSLRATLEAGLPTARNKTSGHGQGSVPVTVPDHLAAYALHLAAANIVLLVQAHKAMK